MEIIHTQASPFLALPFELRIMIYKELLNPGLGTPLLLYHDQTGSAKDLNIYPSILQVNSQVYSEASPVLYDLNIFEIDISNTSVKHSGTRTEPPLPLFRSDTAPNNIPVRSNGRRLTVHTRPSGLMYPHCFQRLRRIELVTSHSTIWALSFRSSHTGQLILSILQSLAKPDVPDARCEKTLKVTTPRLFATSPDMRIFTLGDGNSIGSMSHDRRQGDDERRMLSNLLQAVEKQRTVNIVEMIDP